MPVSSVMPVPAGAKRAGLVAVDGRTYPLESARIEARADGGVAFTTLTQTYRNPYSEPLEVLYTLPLPADGAVVGYAIRLGERVIRGEVRPREEALAEYKKALFEGKTAALLEQERDDTFTQRLGALPPGVTAEVSVEVLQGLAFLPAEEGEAPRWEFRFPTVAGVRYEGEPGRVDDAGSLDVDRSGDSGAIPTRFELAVTVADGAKAVTSPSHPLICEPGDAATVVRLGERARLDRDLVVRWDACAAEVGVKLVEGPGLPGDGGRYALVTVTPPAAPELAHARDLSILIDASGSMSGKPIAWAKEVACGLLDSLAEGDRFSITAFASSPRSLTKNTVEATPRNIEHAKRAVRGVTAEGATEMTRAVFEALSPLRDDAQRQVVLVTDGYIGFEGEVVAEVLRRLPGGSRLHVVGVGSAPNRTLTLNASRAGRGVETFVFGDDEVAGAVRRLVKATARPVLTDVSVTGPAVRAFAPGRPRDVFAGQPLVLAVELRPEGGEVEVKGHLAGETEPWVWMGPVAATPKEASSIAVGALFGRETVADLELAGATERDADVVDARIERTAMRHRIASRRTSLVAVSEEPSVDPLAPRRKERLPVEVPAFVSVEGAGLAGPRFDTLYDLAAYTTGEWEMPSLEPACLALPSRSISFADRVRRTWHRGHSAELDLGEAEALRVERELVVIEFRVPYDGFTMPLGRVDAEIGGLRARRCRVDSSLSTPTGPHAAGTIVRMALVLDAGETWPAGAEVHVTWTDTVAFHLRFTVPTA